MASTRRKFPREFKVNALKRFEAGDSMAEVARFCQVDPNILWRWRRDFLRAPEAAFPGPGRSPDGSRIAELQKRIERYVREIDYLKQCVRRMEKTNDASAGRERSLYSSDAAQIPVTRVSPHSPLWLNPAG